MARREFHFQDGSSNKFWTIELASNSFTVHFGRVGTAGQTQTKDFSSEAAAQAAYDKLIAEKVKKGYQEVTKSKASTPTRASASAAAPAGQPSEKASASGAVKGTEKASLLSQLPKRLQKMLQEPYQNRFARLSIKEWLAACWNFEAFYKSDYEERRTDQEIAKMVASQAKNWPAWSAEQVRTAFSFLTVVQNPIDPIARRILRADPAELAIGESLSLRCSVIDLRLTELTTTWLTKLGASSRGVDHKGGQPLNPSRLPHALAVRDLPWAQQVADDDYAAGGEKLAPEALAILAAYRRDIEALRAHLPRGRVYKYDEWKWICLRGIAAQDPEQVRAGLQQELERNRSSRTAMEEAGFGIVNLDVHGFYRLCQHVSPELVSTFDVRQTFPWDIEFHDWVEAHKNPLAGLDLAHISPVLHEALVHLKLPAWQASGERNRPERPKEVDQAFSLFAGLKNLFGGFFEPGRDERTDAAAKPELAPGYGLGSIHDEMLPIALNLADVESAIGSRDTALVNLLVERFKDDIARDDRFIARQLDEGVMPDEEEQEDDDLEDDEANREGILDAMEGIKERLLKRGS
jgi:predicted DNA-binding WGR domain protein